MLEYNPKIMDRRDGMNRAKECCHYTECNKSIKCGTIKDKLLITHTPLHVKCHCNISSSIEVKYLSCLVAETLITHFNSLGISYFKAKDQ